MQACRPALFKNAKSKRSEKCRRAKFFDVAGRGETKLKHLEEHFGADVRMHRNVPVRRSSKAPFILFTRYAIIAAFHTRPLC